MPERRELAAPVAEFQRQTFTLVLKAHQGSQASLARACKRSPTTIANIAGAKLPLSGEMAERLAEAVDADHELLLRLIFCAAITHLTPTHADVMIALWRGRESDHRALNDTEARIALIEQQIEQMAARDRGAARDESNDHSASGVFRPEAD
jgi:plasmid maintenance system antidote protein VapI